METIWAGKGKYCDYVINVHGNDLGGEGEILWLRLVTGEVLRYDML